jgi:hypothetical protein
VVGDGLELGRRRVTVVSVGAGGCEDRSWDDGGVGSVEKGGKRARGGGGEEGDVEVNVGLGTRGRASRKELSVK